MRGSTAAYRTKRMVTKTTKTDGDRIMALFHFLKPGEGLTSDQVALLTGIPHYRAVRGLSNLYRNEKRMHRSAYWFERFAYTWLYGPKHPNFHRLSLVTVDEVEQRMESDGKDN